MTRPPTLAEAARVWAKIGLLGFGGPAGQIALMHRILVDEKKWISESRFLHALNFCMLLPGPEAQQLATYVGWLLHRMRGGLIAGTLFILPGCAIVLALSYLYAVAGDVPLVQGLFAGLKPAVTVIVFQAVIRIGSRSLKSAKLATLAAVALIAMFVFNVPFPFIIAAAGLLGAVGAKLTRQGVSVPGTEDEPSPERPLDSQSPGPGYILAIALVFGTLWLAPTVTLYASLGADNVFTQIGVFFSKMAVVTFGGAYAVLAYVSQAAVTDYGWLVANEMIDGLALAETTPGPLILVTQFVGYLAAFREPGMLSAPLAGLLGAALTVWVTFVPCFLWIFLGAPYMERLRQVPVLSSALEAITAAVVGVIVNLALWFAMHTLFAEVTAQRVAGIEIEWPVLASLQVSSLLLMLVAAVLLFRLRASLLVTLGVTGLLGMLAAFF